MNQRIMELAREAQVAISRRELDELLQAEQDYTRAVISERDQYMENTIWQAKRIAELKEANSSLAGASIVPDDMVLISRKELAELREADLIPQDALFVNGQMGAHVTRVTVQPKAEPVQEQPVCNQHPKAPHGFSRNSSHSLGRYVCECEGWDAYQAGYQKGVEDTVEEDSAEPVQEPFTWTGTEVDLAVILLGRLDVSGDDAVRIDQIEEIVKRTVGLRKAAQMALEALGHFDDVDLTEAAIEALRKELGHV
jgi:hypothetical protein